MPTRKKKAAATKTKAAGDKGGSEVPQREDVVTQKEHVVREKEGDDEVTQKDTVDLDPSQRSL
jgi:hypothetical protein